ncbi:MAG: hypothetical protein ABII01_02300 [Candidatus Woesearchaeota archaeon]
MKKTKVTKENLFISFLAALFLVLVFSGVNHDLTGSAVLTPTENPSTNFIFSIIVPFILVMIFFIVVLQTIKIDKKTVTTNITKKKKKK